MIAVPDLCQPEPIELVEDDPTPQIQAELLSALVHFLHDLQGELLEDGKTEHAYAAGLMIERLLPLLIEAVEEWQREEADDGQEM